MNRTILHAVLAFLIGAIAAAVLVIGATAVATAEPGHNCVWTGGGWAGQGPCPGMPPASAAEPSEPEPAEPSEPADARTEVLVQVCEPDLFVSIWRDNGTLDSIGIQWPNSQYDSRTRPGPVTVNGIQLDPAAYVWGESAWFTTVQDPADAPNVLIQYGECGAMIAENGEVLQAPALAAATDLGYAPDVETGTDDDEAPIVTPAPEQPERGEFAGRVLKTD